MNRGEIKHAIKNAIGLNADDFDVSLYLIWMTTRMVLRKFEFLE